MKTPLKAFMTGTPIAIEADASALGALDLMIEHGIRHLPVVDAERRVLGVLSFDDLRAAFPQPISLKAPPALAERPSMGELSVGEVMTYAPVTASADVPLEEAAGLLAERRIGCLPVLDPQGRLEGIITETDMLQALATLLFAQRTGRPARRVREETGLVETLRREHGRLLRQLEGYEQHEREITERRREAPLDGVEQGAETADAQFTADLARLAVHRLRALEHALERADAGKLGRCERCDGAIPAARLRALPSTTLCIRCARRTEASA